MRYPMKNRYLKIKDLGNDSVEITNMLTGEVWACEADYAGFLQALDGRTNPYRVNRDMDREYVKAYLRDFRESRFLDSGKRIFSLGFGSLYFILWAPKVNQLHRLFGRIWNRLLMLSWLPVLCFGWYTFRAQDYPYVPGGDGTPEYLWLMLLGIVLHEFSHTFACLDYGGDFYCTGAMFQNFLPGAFVMIDFENVKGRFLRIQIHGAGIEANLLLAGVLLSLLGCGRFSTFTLLMGAFLNLVLAAFNTSLIDGLDGMGIYTELMGCRDFLKNAKKIAFSRSRRRRLRARGANGIALITASYIIIVFQLLLPLVVTLNLVTLAGLWL